MAKTQLEIIGEQIRIQGLAINTYTGNNGYGVTNPNAISDGDEKGKGENQNGEIGSDTDIQTRMQILGSNR